MIRQQGQCFLSMLVLLFHSQILMAAEGRFVHQYGFQLRKIASGAIGNSKAMRIRWLRTTTANGSTRCSDGYFVSPMPLRDSGKTVRPHRFWGLLLIEARLHTARPQGPSTSPPVHRRT